MFCLLALTLKLAEVLTMFSSLGTFCGMCSLIVSVSRAFHFFPYCARTPNAEVGKYKRRILALFLILVVKKVFMVRSSKSKLCMLLQVEDNNNNSVRTKISKMITPSKRQHLRV